jgi:thiosulfate dehydrogenase [quinone] large subunit
MPRAPRDGGGTPRSALPNMRALTVMLVLLRVFVGVQFLMAGSEKWDWFHTAQPLVGEVTRWTAGAHPAALAAFVPFLKDTVLPHAPWCAWTIALGETAVGILLMVGLATRLAALFGLALNTYALLATWNLGPAVRGFNELSLALCLTFLVVGAGRAYGLDARLAKKRPGGPLW